MKVFDSHEIDLAIVSAIIGFPCRRGCAILQPWISANVLCASTRARYTSNAQRRLSRENSPV